MSTTSTTTGRPANEPAPGGEPPSPEETPQEEQGVQEEGDGRKMPPDTPVTSTLITITFMALTAAFTWRDFSALHTMGVAAGGPHGDSAAVLLAAAAISLTLATTPWVKSRHGKHLRLDDRLMVLMVIVLTLALATDLIYRITIH